MELKWSSPDMSVGVGLRSDIICKHAFTSLEFFDSHCDFGVYNIVIHDRRIVVGVERLIQVNRFPRISMAPILDCQFRTQHAWMRIFE